MLHQGGVALYIVPPLLLWVYDRISGFCVAAWCGPPQAARQQPTCCPVDTKSRTCRLQAHAHTIQHTPAQGVMRPPPPRPPDHTTHFPSFQPHALPRRIPHSGRQPNPWGHARWQEEPMRCSEQLEHAAADDRLAQARPPGAQGTCRQAGQENGQPSAQAVPGRRSTGHTARGHADGAGRVGTAGGVLAWAVRPSHFS